MKKFDSFFSFLAVAERCPEPAEGALEATEIADILPLTRLAFGKSGKLLTFYFLPPIRLRLRSGQRSATGVGYDKLFIEM